MCLCTFLASEQLKTREVSATKVRECMQVSTTKFYKLLKDVEDLLIGASSTSSNAFDGAFRYTPLPVWTPKCDFCKKHMLRCWVRARPIKGRASDKCEPCFMRRTHACEQSEGTPTRVVSKPRSKKINANYVPAGEDTATTPNTHQDPPAPRAVSLPDSYPSLVYPPSPSGSHAPANVDPRPIGSPPAEPILPSQKTDSPVSKEIGQEILSRKRSPQSEERPDDGKRCKKPKFDEKPQRKPRSKAPRQSRTQPAPTVSIPSVGRRSRTAVAPTQADGPDAMQQYVLFAHDKALDIISHIEKNGCADLRLQVAISDMKATLENFSVFDRIDDRSAAPSADTVNKSLEVLRYARKDVEKAAENVGADDIKLKILLVAFLRRLADLGGES